MEKKVQSPVKGEKPQLSTILKNVKQVPLRVTIKLIVFTVLMFSLPFVVFFYLDKNYFPGNQTYSAVGAVITVNVVVFAYIIAAALEDQRTEEDEKKNK